MKNLSKKNKIIIGIVVLAIVLVISVILLSKPTVNKLVGNWESEVIPRTDHVETGDFLGIEKYDIKKIYVFTDEEVSLAPFGIQEPCYIAMKIVINAEDNTRISSEYAVWRIQDNGRIFVDIKEKEEGQLFGEYETDNMFEYKNGKLISSSPFIQYTYKKIKEVPYDLKYPVD